MAQTIIEIIKFEDATTEEEVVISLRTKKVTCIRRITCKCVNDFADVNVSFRLKVLNSLEFATYTANDIDLSYTKRFQFIIDTNEIWVRAENYLKTLEESSVPP